VDTSLATAFVLDSLSLWVYIKSGAFVLLIYIFLWVFVFFSRVLEMWIYLDFDVGDLSFFSVFFSL